jgi:tyrosyl-tRNA synthetase
VQAYDSVALQADVELGGTDQLFNLNVGRDIMPAFDLPPQIVMTTPLLEGLDGVEKMSKSLGNYVGVTDPPGEMFGKLMSISDELMWRYYLLLTDLASAEIEALKARVASGEVHPKQAKIDLARRIVTEFHDAAAADHAVAEFDRVHARHELPSTLKEIAVDFGDEPTRALARVIADLSLAASASEAARKIQQGGVRLDGERITDPKRRLDRDALPATLQVGRQALRIVSRQNGKAPQ